MKEIPSNKNLVHHPSHSIGLEIEGPPYAREIGQTGKRAGLTEVSDLLIKIIYSIFHILFILSILSYPFKNQPQTKLSRSSFWLPILRYWRTPGYLRRPPKLR
ncbi:hypothetical protein KEJ19_02635 [Candidatus Bathyarchaeota archaeon]|nr:hypothetical protein [Candidatus Bathyarchaeota archaeon]